MPIFVFNTQKEAQNAQCAGTVVVGGRELRNTKGELVGYVAVCNRSGGEGVSYVTISHRGEVGSQPFNPMTGVIEGHSIAPLLEYGEYVISSKLPRA